AGARRFRITTGFRDDEANVRLVELLRGAAADVGGDVAIYFDVSRGAKLRLLHDEPRAVVAGDEVVVAVRPAPGELPVERDLPPLDGGTVVYAGDAEVELELVDADVGRWRFRAVHDGFIRPRKALSAPGVVFGHGAVNAENRADLESAARLAVDFAVLSFVDGPEDVEAGRAALAGSAAEVGVVAKVETVAAMARLDAVVAAADEVMVARGDLALQLPYEDLGVHQWRILAACERAGVPGIVATQLLESVIERRVPNRAEILDVSTAVALGARSIMLGPETCTNPDLVRAIETAARIIDAVARSGSVLRWEPGPAGQ
ncbi:MAG TPA: pyruvate kinase, partial [Iamia sp.]